MDLELFSSFFLSFFKVSATSGLCVLGLNSLDDDPKSEWIYSFLGECFHYNQ